MRSFEPTDKKSAAAAISSSCHKSDGTSTITPRLVVRGGSWPRLWLHLSSRSNIARAVRNHGGHDLEVAPRRGADEGAELHPQKRRTVEPDAQRAPAERGVLLLHALHVGQELVAADVER